MTNVKMTVHEALAELKMLDKRINSIINETEFVTAVKSSDKKVKGKSVESIVADMNSKFQSFIDLQARRKAIRNALSRSNATTEIVVAGQTWTMAEAIEFKKTGLDNLKQMVNVLGRQIRDAEFTIARKNDALEEKADAYVASIFSDASKNPAESLAVREAYIKNNGWGILSIDKPDKEFENLADQISAFEAEVDSKISISNALTVLEFEY